MFLVHHKVVNSNLHILQPTATAKSTILVKVHMMSWLFGSLNIYWDTGPKEEDEFKSPKPKPTGPQPVSEQYFQNI